MATASSEKKPTYPIGSVDSALRLLLVIGEREQIRIADASTELGVSRSTAHRLMRMLHYHGFVRQDPTTKAYGYGPALFDIGLSVVRTLNPRANARPALERLAGLIDETVQLFVLQQDGRQLACIDAIESSRPLRVGGRIGDVVPAFATACGLAVLAEFGMARVRQLYPDFLLPEIPGAVANVSALEEELNRTRERGYAVQKGELEPEVGAVASAIRDGRGHASFAVSVAVPTSRLTDESIPRLGEATRQCAAAIADALPW